MSETRWSIHRTAAVLLVAWMIGYAIVLLTSCSGGEPGQDCELKIDGWHCTCPDPNYIVIDDKPWPCGHPTDGSCDPVSDCSSDRTCISDDGATVVVISQAELTVTKGECTDRHSIQRQ